MKQVEKWKWRVIWAGRLTTTRIAYTEAEIRREHPEALKLEGSRIVVDLPETEAEIQAAQRAPRRDLNPDGSIRKMWNGPKP
jgi:hypothetical protein